MADYIPLRGTTPAYTYPLIKSWKEFSCGCRLPTTRPATHTELMKFLEYYHEKKVRTDG